MLRLTAADMYGEINPTQPDATVTPAMQATDEATRKPAAGKASRWTDDPTVWLMVIIGAAVIAASYAATGTLPEINIGG